MAEAIRIALELPAEERQVRMRRMRSVVQEHNVYRWAGNLIAELSNVRLAPENLAALSGLKGYIARTGH
jgi:trehalose-6-phosphate synthase